MNVILSHARKKERAIAGVYETQFPTKQQCKDGMWTTGSGRGACNWHGGLSSGNTLSSEIKETKEYIILTSLRGKNLNKLSVEQYTGLKVGRQRDISPEYIAASGGKSVERLIEDLTAEDLEFYSISPNEVGEIISDMLQRSYKDNMRQLATIKLSPSIFGVKMSLSNQAIATTLLAGGALYGLYRAFK